jgi:hypothetical protein
MLPHALAAELQTRPNRQLSLFEVTLDSNMGGEARKKKTNGEWKMWYTRRGGENGEWRMENGTSTAQLSHGAALANAFATANLRSGFPFRPPTSGLCPSDQMPQCPAFFFAMPFRVEGTKTETVPPQRVTATARKGQNRWVF